MGERRGRRTDSGEQRACRGGERPLSSWGEEGREREREGTYSRVTFPRSATGGGVLITMRGAI